jgi:glutamate/tyrosine decarboxylase-like PLP-dependent enzyme
MMPHFPSGIDRYEFLDAVSAFERACDFPTMDMGLFGAGLHLTSSEALPWGDSVRELVEQVYVRFIHGTTWMAEDGILRMQDEVVQWLGAILGAPDPAGLITSGGTESNLLGLLTAKKRANRTGSVVFPAYTHYSIPKGCEIAGLDPIPVTASRGPQSTITVEDIAAAIREDTIAMILTAGSDPFGLVDDVAAVAPIAVERNIYLHVDACFGGFLLPFLERTGYYDDLPLWDFRVPGVCSISADPHKNGMAPPPASAIVFQREELLESARAICPPHGAVAGTRPGGPIAGAWAMVKLLGIDGYCAVSAKTMALRDQLIDGVCEIDDLAVVPGSKINVFTVYSRTRDLYPVWRALRENGWVIGKKNDPPPTSLVLCTMPHNDGVIESFLADLEEAVADAGLLEDRDPDRAGARPLDSSAYPELPTRPSGRAAQPLG